MGETRLEIADDPRGGWPDRPVVPPPLPPDDPEAWYAPNVERQDEIHPGVVVTIASRRTGFTYSVREPVLTAADPATLDRLERALGDDCDVRPRTREGAREAMASGFGKAHERTFDRLADESPAARRRLRYHALARVGCLGEATPYALDDRVEVVDPGPRALAFHTGDYAPATTDLDPDHEAVERLASERTDRYVVEWFGFEVPVVRYRPRLLDGDGAAEKAAVLEPPLRSGDWPIVEDCAEQLRDRVGGWTGTRDDEDVQSTARSLVADRVRRGAHRSAIDRVSASIRAGLARVSPRTSPVERDESTGSIDALIYYVLREAGGLGPLTVPVLDPNANGVEVDRVGDPVVLRDGDSRVPTTCQFADEAGLRRVASRLAAAGGVDLEPGDATTVVRVEHPFVESQLQCSVGLADDGSGAHLTVRTDIEDSATPVGLVERGALPPELVALVWLCSAHGGTVLVSGPDEFPGTALLSALAPFVPAHARSVAVGATPSAIEMFGEPDVSLVASDREGWSVGELLGECAAFDPDVVLANDVRDESGYRALGEHVNAGRGVLGTTTARDVAVLVERALDRGMANSLVCELDLVVFHRRVEGDLRVVEAVEFLAEPEYRELDPDGTHGATTADGRTVYWNTIYQRNDGTLDESREGGQSADGAIFDSGIYLPARLAAASGCSVDEIREELVRKRGYVRYLVREGMDEPATLRRLVADLEADEAATVERLHRRARENTARSTK